jgi:pimeloyl-ACP methyl ester carboxylesterase
LQTEIRFKNNIRLIEVRPDAPIDNVTNLLLHGLGNSLDFWLEVIPSLGQARRTIAIDIPGFGQSSCPSDGFSLITVAAAISRLCKILEICNCVVVAHSMGSVVALQLMASQPASFRKLVLVDGTLGRAVNLIRSPGRIFADSQLALYVFAQFVGAVLPVRPWSVRMFSSSAALRKLTLWPYVAHPAHINRDALASALAHNGGWGTARALAVAHHVDYVQLMRAVPHPVDLVWGAADRLITPDDIEQAREVMNVDRELQIPSCGHWPMIERPGVLATFIGSSA